MLLEASSKLRHPDLGLPLGEGRKLRIQKAVQAEEKPKDLMFISGLAPAGGCAQTSYGAPVYSSSQVKALRLSCPPRPAQRVSGKAKRNLEPPDKQHMLVLQRLGLCRGWAMERWGFLRKSPAHNLEFESDGNWGPLK